MSRKTVLSIVAIAGGLMSLPLTASAQDGSSVGIRLQAVVQPFCRIQSELGDNRAMLIGGTAELGGVREICNTPGGYKIDVQLINVASGILHHGTETQILDSDGRTHISWGTARVRSASWRLTQASLLRDDAPVYLRVSISPV